MLEKRLFHMGVTFEGIALISNIQIIIEWFLIGAPMIIGGKQTLSSSRDDAHATTERLVNGRWKYGECSEKILHK